MHSDALQYRFAPKSMSHKAKELIVGEATDTIHGKFSHYAITNSVTTSAATSKMTND